MTAAELHCDLAALTAQVQRIADALAPEPSDRARERERIERTLRDQDVARQVVVNVCRRLGEVQGMTLVQREFAAHAIREMTFDQLLAGVR